MKKQILLFVTVAATIIASCKKDSEKQPNIAFKTGGSYVSGDMTVGRDTTIIVGITASKPGNKDVLLNFDIGKAYNGAAIHSDSTENLSGASANDLSRDISIHVRKDAGTEKYRFLVISKNGYKNSVELTLTVK